MNVDVVPAVADVVSAHHMAVRPEGRKLRGQLILSGLDVTKILADLQCSFLQYLRLGLDLLLDLIGMATVDGLLHACHGLFAPVLTGFGGGHAIGVHCYRVLVIRLQQVA
jgi:hypothetical protein